MIAPDPYRTSSRPEQREGERARFDLEEWTVRGVLAVVGVVGVGVGFAGRPTELALGILLLMSLIWTSRTPPS